MPPPALQPWLLDQGSLTAKLVSRSGGDFRVRVLRQTVARPLLSEQRLLGIPAGRQALVREVVLLGRGQPWVFARSLVPLTSLTGRLRRLRYLRDRPLGAFLFAQPDLQRGALEISRIRASQGYVPAEVSTGEPLWGRRSVFRLDNKPLLVSEVFLPSFTQTLLP
jgi:chorismate lyase